MRASASALNVFVVTRVDSPESATRWAHARSGRRQDPLACPPYRPSSRSLGNRRCPFPRGNSRAPILLVHDGSRGAPVFDRADFEPARLVSSPRSVGSRWFMLVYVGCPRRSFEMSRSAIQEGFEPLLLCSRGARGPRPGAFASRRHELTESFGLRSRIGGSGDARFRGDDFDSHRRLMDCSVRDLRIANQPLGWRRPCLRT